MRKVLFLLLIVPFFGFSQVTFLVDSNFEIALVNQGLDNMVDGYVLNSRIDTVDTLIVANRNISSLVGISGFTALTYLDCSSNNLDSLDVSTNNLKYFNCSSNNLDEIDITANTGLLDLKCSFNNFTNIDVSENTALLYFECYENQLTQLDISNNSSLIELRCNNNLLTSLDVQGIDMYVLVYDNNNITSIANLADNVSLKHLSCSNNNIVQLDITNNTALNWLSCSNNKLYNLDISNQPDLDYLFCWNNNNLSCINVGDVAAANATWTVWNGQSGNIDNDHYFSTNCTINTTTDIFKNKEIFKVVNMFGQECKGIENTPLIYIYDDGTIERKMIIEN